MILKAKITGENTFDPISADDFKKSFKLKPGDSISIETWKERNINFHRKFFALLNTTIYFLPDDPKYDKLRNIDYLRKELMIITGEVDIHITMDGEQVLIPLSISFKSMNEEKFSRLYSLCVDAIIRYYLPHLTIQQFEHHLLEFI